MKIFLILLISLNVFAEDEIQEAVVTPKACEFTIVCTKNEKEFNFDYKVLGDDCTENKAGQLLMSYDDKNIPLEVKGLPLLKIEDFGGLPQLCEVNGRKYPAIEINQDRIALFLKINSKPSLDKLGAVIIDLKKNKVIKVEPNFGEIKNKSFALLKNEKGYRTRLVKEYLKEVQCSDCDAAVVDDWKEISVYSDIFKSKWVKQ